MITILVWAVVLYVAFVGVMYAFQRNLIYYPASDRPSPEDYGVPEMNHVRLSTEDGLSLGAWYAPARDSTEPVLIYFHGNAGHIGDRAVKVRAYLDAGLGVLMVSYRGYGGNTGRPTEAGLYADGRAALRYLAGEGIAADRIILYGESLGGGVAVRMATEMAETQPAAAVVLEAPFTTAADVAQRHYFYLPARWLVRDRYDSLRIIGQIGAPLLILHGERDRTVPVDLARRLLAAAPEPKSGIFYPRAGHNDLLDYGAASAVLSFVARHGPYRRE